MRHVVTSHVTQILIPTLGLTQSSADTTGSGRGLSESEYVSDSSRINLMSEWLGSSLVRTRSQNQMSLPNSDCQIRLHLKLLLEVKVLKYNQKIKTTRSQFLDGILNDIEGTLWGCDF